MPIQPEKPEDPDGISFEEAASLPVAALTALNGLRLCGDLAGRSVLINGATGGVGHVALQIARARGASVTAVCSSRNSDLARELGADAVVDYALQDFAQGCQVFDVKEMDRRAGDRRRDNPRSIEGKVRSETERLRE